MDSRAVIKKVIEFDNPGRIGFCLSDGYPNDFVFADAKKREDFDSEWHKPEDFITEYRIFIILRKGAFSSHDPLYSRNSAPGL